MANEQPETSCVEVDTLLAFVSGSLLGERLAAVEKHLDLCTECQRRGADLAAQATRSTSVGSEGRDRAPDSAIPQRGALIAERYRVGAWIGRGGMGCVVEATHLELKHTVAIKFLRVHDPASVARFLREGRTVAQLRSPHIVRVLDAGQTQEGAPFLVMERLEGADLATVLARGPLPLSAAQRYVREACAALEVAHAAGVIHRDLKPSNMFIVSDGQLKVLDFGISKHVRAPDVEPTITATGHVLGSPRYMSPEQLQGTRKVDARTDIWSLGVILYELLAGRPPFDQRPFSALAIAIATQRPAPPSHYQAGVPPELDAIALRCLEKQPARRFQSAADLDEALARLEAPHRGTSRRKLWIAAWLTLLLAAAGLANLRMRQKESTATQSLSTLRAEDHFLGGTACESCLAESCPAEQAACVANQKCAGLRTLAQNTNLPLVADNAFMLGLFDHWWDLEQRTGSLADARSEFGSCARNKCLDACRIGRNLSCVGNFAWSATYPGHSSQRYRVVVLNNPSRSLAGWKLRACAPGTLCESEMGSGITDDRGMVTLELDLSSRRENANRMPEFNGYILFDGGPDFNPQVFRQTAPASARWYTRFFANPRDETRRLHEPRGLREPGPELGVVDMQVQDCSYTSAWGMTLEIWRYGAGRYVHCRDCLVAYPDQSGVPDLALKKIESWSRAASEVALTPGEYAVAARDAETNKLVAFMNHVSVQSGYEHTLLLFPLSSDELQHVPEEIVAHAK